VIDAAANVRYARFEVEAPTLGGPVDALPFGGLRRFGALLRSPGRAMRETRALLVRLPRLAPCATLTGANTLSKNSVLLVNRLHGVDTSFDSRTHSSG
jgi:hypothetical protein